MRAAFSNRYVTEDLKQRTSRVSCMVGRHAKLRGRRVPSSRSRAVNSSFARTGFCCRSEKGWQGTCISQRHLMRRSAQGLAAQETKPEHTKLCRSSEFEPTGSRAKSEFRTLGGHTAWEVAQMLDNDISASFLCEMARTCDCEKHVLARATAFGKNKSSSPAPPSQRQPCFNC